MNKKTKLTWTRDEVELLINNLDEEPNKLVRLFPNRSYFSILSKRNKIVRKSKSSDENQIRFDFSETINASNESINDINVVLDQALKKVEELMIENAMLKEANKDLEDKLSQVNYEFESQKNKVDELANQTKGRWSMIKRVFF